MNEYEIHDCGNLYCVGADSFGQCTIPEDERDHEQYADFLNEDDDGE